MEPKHGVRMKNEEHGKVARLDDGDDAILRVVPILVSQVVICNGLLAIVAVEVCSSVYSLYCFEEIWLLGPSEFAEVELEARLAAWTEVEPCEVPLYLLPPLV